MRIALLFLEKGNFSMAKTRTVERVIAGKRRVSRRM